MEGRGDLGSQFEGTVRPGRKAWRLECEVAGHVAATARKKGEMKAGTRVTFILFFNPGP